jgi:hypothetical protein
MAALAGGEMHVSARLLDEQSGVQVCTLLHLPPSRFGPVPEGFNCALPDYREQDGPFVCFPSLDALIHLIAFELSRRSIVFHL